MVSHIFANDIVCSFQSISCASSRPVRLVSWAFPGIGKLKLNPDGSTKGNPGSAGFGGVLREERGHWIRGFFGRLEECTSLEAELWDCSGDSKMIRQQGLEAMEVESDSTAAIDLINGEPPENSPHTILIKECKALMKAT